MEESAKSAEAVRNDLNSFRNRSVTISATDQCTMCSSSIFLTPFFIFPCGHKFHGDCLEKYLLTILPDEECRQLTSLKTRLSMNINQRQDNTNKEQLDLTRQQLKDQLENILTADCPLCGDLMIDALDQPFTEEWGSVSGWD